MRLFWPPLNLRFAAAAGTSLVVLASLVTWTGFPIYTDEIAYRIFSSRLFLDGFERISFMPFCGEPSSMRVPLSYLPAATIFAGYSLFDDLIINRITAILAVAFGFLSLRFAITRNITASTSARSLENARATELGTAIFCSAILVCCIGVLPATYMMARGESSIYILVGLVGLAFASRDKDLRYPTFFSATILLLFTMAAYLHPKTFYFVPAVALSLIALLWHRSRTKLTIVLAGLIWASVEGYLLNRAQFTSCPDTPAFEALLQSYNIDPISLFSHPLTFLSAVIDNFSAEQISRIVERSSYATTYQVNFLPTIPRLYLSETICNLLIVGCWFGIATLSVAASFWYLRRIVSAMRTPRDRNIESHEALNSIGMLALYAGVTAHLLLNRSVAWYDPGYWFLLYTMLGASSLARMANPCRAVRRGSAHALVAAGFLFILTTAALSSYASYRTFYAGFRGGFAGPGLSRMNLLPAAVRKDVAQALNKCGLKADSPRLIVDDLTYLFLQRSYKPIPISYALYGRTSVEAVSKAKAIGSSGMVLRCQFRNMFPELDQNSEGQVCCVRFSN